MQITYGPWGETLAELVEAAQAAEAAGAGVVWFPELHRTSTISAAAVAPATHSVGIGTAVALAFVRSPMTMALEAIDIDELSGGRFRLGLATGVQRLNEDWHNARWGKPVAHLRETVACIREFVARAGTGEPMSVDGEWEHLRIRGYQRPFHQVRTEIPVYLGSVGPQMTRLVGEIGDGWLAHELCSPSYVDRQILPHLATGLDQAGRSRDSLDVVASVCAAVDPDARQARRWVAGTVGFYASVRTYADFFAFHGLAAEQARVVEAFRSAATSDDLGDAVADVMVERLAAAGTADDVRAAIAAYEGLVDTVKLTPPTHGCSPEETRRAQAQLLELVGDLTGGAR